MTSEADEDECQPFPHPPLNSPLPCALHPRPYLASASDLNSKGSPVVCAAIQHEAKHYRLTYGAGDCVNYKLAHIFQCLRPVIKVVSGRESNIGQLANHDLASCPQRLGRFSLASPPRLSHIGSPDRVLLCSSPPDALLLPMCTQIPPQSRPGPRCRKSSDISFFVRSPSRRGRPIAKCICRHQRIHLLQVIQSSVKIVTNSYHVCTKCLVTSYRTMTKGREVMLDGK